MVKIKSVKAKSKDIGYRNTPKHVAQLPDKRSASNPEANAVKDGEHQRDYNRKMIDVYTKYFRINSSNNLKRTKANRIRKSKSQRKKRNNQRKTDINELELSKKLEESKSKKTFENEKQNNIEQSNSGKEESVLQPDLDDGRSQKNREIKNIGESKVKESKGEKSTSEKKMEKELKKKIKQTYSEMKKNEKTVFDEPKLQKKRKLQKKTDINEKELKNIEQSMTKESEGEKSTLQINSKMEENEDDSVDSSQGLAGLIEANGPIILEPQSEEDRTDETEEESLNDEIIFQMEPTVEIKIEPESEAEMEIMTAPEPLEIQQHIILHSNHLFAKYVNQDNDQLRNDNGDKKEDEAVVDVMERDKPEEPEDHEDPEEFKPSTGFNLSSRLPACNNWNCLVL